MKFLSDEQKIRFDKYMESGLCLQDSLRECLLSPKSVIFTFDPYHSKTECIDYSKSKSGFLNPILSLMTEERSALKIEISEGPTTEITNVEKR